MKEFRIQKTDDRRHNSEYNTTVFRFRIPDTGFRLLFFHLILLNSAFCILAQDSLPPKKLFINLSAHYGFIIPHNPSMKYLIKKHIPAGELDLIQLTNGNKNWEKIYKNPEKGLGIYFADLGNPEQLGQAIGVFPFVNFPLNPGKKFKLFVRSSNGIGIITKPYHRINNHKNNINGSRINGYVNLRLNTVFYPANNIRMETGIGLTHLSNSAWAVPNLGINIATINIGISFNKNKELSISERNSLGSHEVLNDTTHRIINHKPFFTLIASAGPNETNPPDGKKYAAYSLSAFAWKTISEKSRVCAGVDAFYEMANIAAAIRDTTFDTNNDLNNLQLGLKGGYEMVIGKFALPLEMGVYLFSKTTVNGSIYHRIGVRYYATKHLILNYSLRTHWATAENIELGVGYRF